MHRTYADMTRAERSARDPESSERTNVAARRAAVDRARASIAAAKHVHPFSRAAYLATARRALALALDAQRRAGDYARG